MNEQLSVQELLHKIKLLTSVYQYALGPNGHPGFMTSYLKGKGFSYADLPGVKNTDPAVCLLFKETIANELDYLYLHAKIAARQEISCLECAPNA